MCGIVGYVGNRGTRIAVFRNYNATPARYLSTLPTRDQARVDFLSANFANPFSGLNPIFGANISRANLLRPYPEFGDITVEEPIGYSWYHSLQTQIEKRFSQGYTFQLAYTWAKTMEAVEFLNEKQTGRKTIFIFSDLKEDLEAGYVRDLVLPLDGFEVVALNVTKLRSDNLDPREYLERLEVWRARVEGEGGTWRVINDLDRLEALLGG